MKETAEQKEKRALVPQGGGTNMFQVGIALGIAAGLFDALRAIAASGGPASTSMAALLISMVVMGIGGAIILPLIAIFIGKSPLETGLQKPFLKRLATKSLQAATGVLGTSVCGFVMLKMVSALLPGHPPLRQAALAFIAAGLIMIVLIRLLKGQNTVRPVLAPATMGIICLTAVFAILLWGKGLFSAVDYGEGIKQRTDASLPNDLPNVLFIVMDTARAQNLSLYGYARETTPFLSELARESTVYERAFATDPWTLPSHATMFTGQFPSMHRATTEHRMLESEFTTLAEILSSRGYATAGFSANSIVGPTHNLHQGFNNFFELYNMDSFDPVRRLLAFKFMKRLFVRIDNPKVRASTINRCVKEWLGQRKETDTSPFFIFINYIDPHLPYFPPEPYRSRFLKTPLTPQIEKLCGTKWLEQAFYLMGMKDSVAREEYEQIAALYDGELAYTDAQLRDFIDDLKQDNYLDNTLLIITSDHGENLGEHGGLLDHCLSLHQTLLHVPLLVHYPPLFQKGLRYKGLVSILSIFPTILEVTASSLSPDWPPALGALPRTADAPGLDFAIAEYNLPVFELSLLVSQVHGVDITPYAVRQRAIQNASWKMIARADGISHLYNIRSDPGEEKPLNPAEHQEGLLLTEQLRKFVAAQQQKHAVRENDLIPLDEITGESLRSLGYVE